MTEIKDCLPTQARGHFINLRNVRLESETNKYQTGLQESRRQAAAQGVIRSGARELREWQLKEEQIEALAIGFIEDALATCKLYDIHLTRPLCECLLNSAQEQLSEHYKNALQAHAQGVPSAVKIPLSVRSQMGNSPRFAILNRIRVVVETARVGDEKARANSTPQHNTRTDAIALELDLDGLLGIPSRKEYDTRLSKLFAAANPNVPLSLIMIDLDHFKKVNDTFGHGVGDAVLKTTAQAIQEATTGKGELFRYGGEEIVVLLPNHDPEESAAAASRIRRAIEAAKIEKVESGVTASLGVATFPHTATDVKDLFEKADAALYRSKNEGRNRVTLASTSDEYQPANRKAVLPSDHFEEHVLSEARSLLSELTYIQRDFIRLLLTRGSCENYLAVKLANVSEDLVLDAFAELPRRGIVERHEDHLRLSFSISDHWRNPFKQILFPRDEGNSPPAFK